MKALSLFAVYMPDWRHREIQRLPKYPVNQWQSYKASE